MVMGIEDGEVGEVGVESSPQPDEPGWQLPAGCGRPSKLRHDCVDIDDQLPGCPEPIEMSEILLKL